jgi:hypothetical protein
MSPIILTLIILALAVYGLERNHVRPQHLRRGLAGSVDTEDRDHSRVRAELRAVRDRQAHIPAQRRSTSGPVSRLAPATHGHPETCS